MDSSPKRQSMDESPLTSSPTSNRSLSPFFFPDDEEDIYSPHHCDELPVFQLERSLSPIAAQRLFASPYQVTEHHHYTQMISDDESDHPDFVSLDEIHSLIGTAPPEDDEMEMQVHKLETIFEGIFLETPPRGQPKSAGMARRPKVHRMIYDDNAENVPPSMDEKVCNNNNQHQN